MKLIVVRPAADRNREARRRPYPAASGRGPDHPGGDDPRDPRRTGLPTGTSSRRTWPACAALRERSHRSRRTMSRGAPKSRSEQLVEAARLFASTATRAAWRMSGPPELSPPMATYVEYLALCLTTLMRPLGQGRPGGEPPERPAPAHSPPRRRRWPRTRGGATARSCGCAA
jgi:hypothetical protein